MYCTGHAGNKNLRIFVWMRNILRFKKEKKRKTRANKHMYYGNKDGNGEPTEARLVVCRPPLVV